ncbi:MAG: hypothetical protein ABI837_19775, partial [Acidobacteriota bacterium]
MARTDAFRGTVDGEGWTVHWPEASDSGFGMRLAVTIDIPRPGRLREETVSEIVARHPEQGNGTCADDAMDDP